MESGSAISKLFSFLGDVRQEANKVSWPSRKEVVVTTVIVFVLAIVFAIFFNVVDVIVYKLIHFVIGR